MNAVERFLVASRARNVDAASAELAPDVVMLNPATDDPVVGKQAVAAALRAVEEACDEFRHTHLFADVSRTEAPLYGLVFEAKIGTATLRGVDLIEIDERDRIARFEVAARPMAALTALGSRMSGSRASRGRAQMSERSGTLAEDPFSGRRPTSHERMAGQPWDASYHDGPAPWDVGPQPAIVRLASEGGFAGEVLDAGCGTGENALHIASLGLRVLGVDVAETAVAIAREKAEDRGIEAGFVVADALQLGRLGRTFETVLDCGLFHTFDDDDERRGYAASLASVTERDGALHVLCFSDVGPDIGPHPISQEELRAAFNPGDGWNVIAIEPNRVQTRCHDGGAPAWFATIKRI